MRAWMAIVVWLAALGLLSGCAPRCHRQDVPMYWADGSMSMMHLTVCNQGWR